MPKNPFTDVWLFLIGASEDHINNLGSWRYPVTVLFIALLAASVYLAVRNWREDPEQRTGRHLGTWGARVLIGCMWFEAVLWKVPLPVPGAVKFWTEQMAMRAAFASHREFVMSVLLPNLHWFAPLVFLAELTFAVSLILGFGVRLAGVLCMLFVLHLWLGIYLPGDPHEWPWCYMFLALLMFLFVLYAAGRSLGLDGWLRRHMPAVRDRVGFWGQLFHAVG
jgi:uncharacterized membrane protein YphA (DoxX/SURF4 family)